MLHWSRNMHLSKYFNLPNNRAGWNKRAGWTFFKVSCTFIRQTIVKRGKKGPNKDVQDGFFPKKNKVCCTIIWQVKVFSDENLPKFTIVHANTINQKN